MNNDQYFLKESERKWINVSFSIFMLMLVAMLILYVYDDMQGKKVDHVVEPTKIIKVDCGLYDADIDKHEYMCYKIEVILKDYYKENLK